MDNPFKLAHFERVDPTPDTAFYEMPRLVKHIDEPACEALAAFYKELLPEGGDVLDLMSSCVSHLPEDGGYGSVTGLGMNAVELEANPQLSGHIVHDLNVNPTLPFEDSSFDGCILAVSVQYITQPKAVFREIGRVLRPDAPLAISYSNRMFPTKAVAIWRAMSDSDRAGLIDMYIHVSEAFGERHFRNLSPRPGKSDPLYVVVARRVRK